VRPKTSRYNSLIFYDNCAICQNETASDEIHHIVPQRDSNSKGFLPNLFIHKNRASNLIPVCASCHDKIDVDKIIVDGFSQTNQGIRLNYKIPNDSK
jgi:hypothetical protein